MANQKAYDHQMLFRALLEPLEGLKYGNCDCWNTLVPLMQTMKARAQKLEAKGKTEASLEKLQRKLKAAEEGCTAKEKEA